MEKERFVNEILNSVENATKAIPSEALFQKIEHRIQNTFVSSKTLWLVAASIAVLVSINILILEGKHSTSKNEMASFEYSINKNNQLYK